MKSIKILAFLVVAGATALQLDAKNITRPAREEGFQPVRQSGLRDM